MEVKNTKINAGIEEEALTPQTVQKMASLSRIELNDTEVESYTKQLRNALEYFKQISEIATEGIEPMITPIEIENSWREDQVSQELSVDKIVENAPDKSGHLFRVPPVI